MKKILIFGGTQFVGKRLVGNLLEKGYDITLATRGNWPVPHSSSIQHIKADRYDIATFGELLKTDWDVIVDQLAFSGFDAKLITDTFEGKVGRIVTVSSSAVYNECLDCKEEEFDSSSINMSDIDLSHYRVLTPDTPDYKIGKREVECIYSLSKIPTACVRFPKIIGLDDLYFRFYDLYKKIKNNEDIHIKNNFKKISLINSREAARFLSFIVSSNIEGGINASLDGELSLDFLEKKIERKINCVTTGNEESLFLGEEILLNNKKAKDYGFKFEILEEYLKELMLLYDFYSERF